MSRKMLFKKKKIDKIERMFGVLFPENTVLINKNIKYRNWSRCFYFSLHYHVLINKTRRRGTMPPVPIGGNSNTISRFLLAAQLAFRQQSIFFRWVNAISNMIKKIKNYLNINTKELVESNMSFNEFLDHIKVPSYSKYILALRVNFKLSKIYYKREPNSILINNYNRKYLVQWSLTCIWNLF